MSLSKSYNRLAEPVNHIAVFRVSQSLIMGTVSIANALAFAPNFQKGLTSAAKVLKLVNRIPKVTDNPDAVEKVLVSKTKNNNFNEIINGVIIIAKRQHRVLSSHICVSNQTKYNGA